MCKAAGPGLTALSVASLALQLNLRGLWVHGQTRVVPGPGQAWLALSQLLKSPARVLGVYPKDAGIYLGSWYLGESAGNRTDEAPLVW